MEAHPKFYSSTRSAFLLWCVIFIHIISAVDGSGRISSPSFLSLLPARKGSATFSILVRGGSDTDEYEDEFDSDVYDQEESEQEDSDEEDKYLSDREDVEDSLSRSTRSAASKIKRKSTQSSKAAINASLHTQKNRIVTKKLKLRCPYIIRVCFHPVTILSMTRAYFSSLFNISYLEQEQSQGLRSALEAKAKREGPPSGGKKRGKRAMKPGQAKTLSDLPQLSA